MAEPSLERPASLFRRDFKLIRGFLREEDCYHVSILDPDDALVHLRLRGVYGCLLKHDIWKHGDTLEDDNENHKIDLHRRLYTKLECE
jgi:hypothetical protein